MGEIQRKAIVTITNRRNAENHPEFLSTEVLLERFEPLIKSIHRRFMSYNGLFTSIEDSEELYQQILCEFLRLRQSFDPKRGVDFTGYIQFHLQQRVYHYVTKRQKIVLNEQPAKPFADNDYDEKPIEFENIDELVDEDTVERMERAEAIASIHWEKLTKDQATMVQDILIHHKALEDIAKERRTTIQRVRQEFQDLCDRFCEIAESKESESSE